MTGESVIWGRGPGQQVLGRHQPPPFSQPCGCQVYPKLPAPNFVCPSTQVGLCAVPNLWGCPFPRDKVLAPQFSPRWYSSTLRRLSHASWARILMRPLPGCVISDNPLPSLCLSPIPYEMETVTFMEAKAASASSGVWHVLDQCWLREMK